MFELPKLPFSKGALYPFISKETLEYHYWKHHKAYVDKLNNLILWTKYEGKKLEKIIKNSKWDIFNNAAQVRNHNFYWNCLTPDSIKIPSWKILKLIESNFWSFDVFKQKFSEKAISNFGSWWTWLILEKGKKLKIKNTKNAKTPIKTDEKPILVIDVWEHAYYIDTRNDRAKYLENFWQVVNWEFVNKNLKD